MIVLSELGTRLKEARIAKELNLEDLQAITKIQTRYLQGIEEGNYAIMPGAFYVRAFIKQYAAAVDLDGEQLLHQHKIDMPVTEANVFTKPSDTYSPRNRSITRTATGDAYGEVIPKVLVALFIVLILAVAWYFYSATTNNGLLGEDAVEKETGVPYEQLAPSIEKEVEKPVETETVEEPEKEQPKAVLTVKETQGETTTYSFQGENPQLEITADGPSWIAATDENQQELTSKARVLQAGETEKIDVSQVEFVRVRIGDYTNINLNLNGKPVKYTQQTKPQNIVIQFEVSE